MMRPPFTITTELSIGAAPVPSINFAPTIAVMGAALLEGRGIPRWA
jgi:hypothetical protein